MRYQIRGSRRGLLNWLSLSAMITLGVVLSSSGVSTRLGAPQYWPWLLTGLQVLSLWAAGARHRWGWGLGASVQLPWIAYAILTGQIGFIPGCAISAAVQAYSFFRMEDSSHERSPVDVSAFGASRSVPT